MGFYSCLLKSDPQSTFLNWDHFFMSRQAKERLFRTYAALDPMDFRVYRCKAAEGLPSEINVYHKKDNAAAPFTSHER